MDSDNSDTVSLCKWVSIRPRFCKASRRSPKQSIRILKRKRYIGNLSEPKLEKKEEQMYSDNNDTVSLCKWVSNENQQCSVELMNGNSVKLRK